MCVYMQIITLDKITLFKGFKVPNPMLTMAGTCSEEESMKSETCILALTNIAPRIPRHAGCEGDMDYDMMNFT